MTAHIRMATVVILAVLATLSLANSANAEITIDSVTTGVGPGGGGDKTLQVGFNSGGADKLVVVIGGEHGFPGNTGGNFNSMTYGGVPLTEAVQEGTSYPTLAIFYLDYPGVSGDLVVNQENHNSSPYAIYLLMGTAAGVGATAKNYGYAENSYVDLTTTVAGSMVIAGIDNSGPDGGNYPAALTADAPLVEDADRIGNTRWDTLDAAHATTDSPGPGAYSFSGAAATDVVAIGAAEFLPGAPHNLTLRVDPVTGDTTIVGDATRALSINYYQITSEGDSLDTATWTSLADQDYEGNGPADGSGNGWEEAGGVGSQALAEAYLLGNSTVGAGLSVGLGKGYDPEVDARDLVFRFRTDAGRIMDGLVEYATSARPGDANLDGVVDAADYIALKQSFGMAAGARFQNGDFDLDGDVDGDDLAILQANLGQVAAGASVIPEPATLSLAAMGALALLRRRRF